MTIPELIVILENKLVQLNQVKEKISTSDILAKYEAVSREIKETEETLSKLRTLV